MSPNKKIYISLVIFGAVALSFVFSVFLPVLNQIKNDGKETFYQKETLRALKSREATLVKLREDYQKIAPKLKEIDYLFFDSERPPEVLNYLEETAEDSGVKISGSNLSFVKEGQPWPFFSVQISLTSDFPGLMRFIDRLENAPKLLEIDSPNFKKSGNLVYASFLVKFFTKSI